MNIYCIHLSITTNAWVIVKMGTVLLNTFVQKYMIESWLKRLKVERLLHPLIAISIALDYLFATMAMFMTPLSMGQSLKFVLYSRAVEKMIQVQRGS